MSGLRLRVRLAVTGVALAGVVVVLLLLGVVPELDRLVALAGLGLLLSVLVWEMLPDRSVGWELTRIEPTRPAGQDVGTASWVRLIEAHQTMARPDGALQARLRSTVEDLLRVRRGTSLVALSVGERRALLGDELDALLHDPPRRVSATALLSHLERIERL